MAAPGTASAAPNECPRDNFCAWINDEFSGAMRAWTGNSSNWGTMGDNAESMYNRRASSSTRVDNVRTYLDVNYGRFGVCVNPGETFDLGMNDNDYSSHEWVHTC
ncbi:peptidase inhibitor family I36 protein [Actinomadura sp. 6N118]|uniref:peptidase inhibitor family I36 protein n=1 Tax=Actinomadura sp. 6N118 TaxID=3375151 RepID=UPI00379BECEE